MNSTLDDQIITATSLLEIEGINQKRRRFLQTASTSAAALGHDAGDPDTHERPSTMVSYRTGGTPWLILINPEGQVAYNGFQVHSDKLIEFIESQVS